MAFYLFSNLELSRRRCLHSLFISFYYLDAILFNFRITNNNKCMYIKYFSTICFISFIFFVNNNCLLRRKSCSPIFLTFGLPLRWTLIVYFYYLISICFYLVIIGDVTFTVYESLSYVWYVYANVLWCCISIGCL